MATTLIEQPASKPVTGFKLGALRQKHPEYMGPLWDKLELLWKGGWAMEANARQFVIQAPMEKPEFYEWRCQVTSYVNFFARLVGFLTGSLFNETLQVGPGTDEKDQPRKLPDEPFYKAFAQDCDKRGTDFSQFVRAEVLTKALVYRRALVLVDLPPAKGLEDGSAPQTLAQEDALGNRRAYLVPIDVRSMLNWEKDEFGNFKWCVLHRIYRDRSNPLVLTKKYQHEFKIWMLDESGRAAFMVLRTPLVERDEELNDETDMEVVQPLKATSFRHIPIVDFELPEALWAGNQAGPLCQEHFRRRSDLMGSISRSLVEIQFVKLGPQLPAVRGALPSDRAQDQSRGNNVGEQLAAEGNIVLDKDDEVGYAGPSGVGHEIARAELKDTREEIFGSLNAMALQLENSAAAVGRSGDSKAEDRSAMETLLTFMGDQTREVARDLMRMVSEARKETVEEWVATGLSTFDAEDRGELVAEAGELELVNIPSPTWKRAYMTKVALATVPKASSKQKKDIEDELQKNITDEQVAMDPIEKMQKQAMAQGKFQKNGPPKPGQNDDNAGG